MIPAGREGRYVRIPVAGTVVKGTQPLTNTPPNSP
jgi:hypothetical protein